MKQVGQFIGFDLIELFASFPQFLEGFAYGFGHLVVGLLGTSQDGKVFSLGDSDVPVVAIQPKTEQVGFFFRLWLLLSFLHEII